MTAPIVKHIGERFPGGIYNNETKRGDAYLMISQTFFKIVTHYLSGHAGNEMKLLFALMGTSDGFTLNEKWITDLTGMTLIQYRKTRTNLCARKWITYVPFQYIGINFQQILRDGLKAKIAVLPSVAATYGISRQEYDELLGTAAN